LGFEAGELFGGEFSDLVAGCAAAIAFAEDGGQFAYRKTDG